jgi:membrane peptidoglycan carboxypeptidase
MELNIGKVMNFAAKAGFPKVTKAYPSMALGTAEATPLEVATAYTMFANLGQKATPVAVNRVTGGDGVTVTAPTTLKTDIVRPNVAYVMDDIMKDVVNRGTAADLHAWGFQNVAGKTAIAGKTGTSRDGWFAGFTPNLVCVVYVGFDDGSDLGMKGADSALPIWADFMKEALAMHPEWNGDWPEPANIRKAEIDIRNGKLIRELGDDVLVNGEQPKDPQKQPTPAVDPNSPLEDAQPLPTPELPKVEDVPPEFRRVELFISGTVPNRNFGNESFEEAPLEELPPVPGDSPSDVPPTPGKTPIEKIEIPQEELERQQGVSPGAPQPQTQSRPDTERTVMVQICPTSGLRASPTCPIMVPKKFKAGTEPKQYCDPSYHR